MVVIGALDSAGVGGRLMSRVTSGFGVRSERMFCEQLDYNLLFRWFLYMDVVEPSFDHSTLSRNRARLLEHDVAFRVFHPRGRAGLQSAVAFGRTLHRGRHAGGLGVAQEFQAQGVGTERAARRHRQADG